MDISMGGDERGPGPWMGLRGGNVAFIFARVLAGGTTVWPPPRGCACTAVRILDTPRHVCTVLEEEVRREEWLWDLFPQLAAVPLLGAEQLQSFLHLRLCGAGCHFHMSAWNEWKRVLLRWAGETYVSVLPPPTQN